ncbi:MAG: hypothetical protein ACXWCB_13310, partial [Acidimicrobiales bacterium]
DPVGQVAATAPSSTPAAPDGLDAASSARPGDPLAVANPSVQATTQTVTPVDPTTGAVLGPSATDGSTSTAPEASPSTTSAPDTPSPSGVLTIIDPCAGPEGGAPPSTDGCRDGLRGTILADTDPGPFRITSAVVSPLPGFGPAYDLCRAQLDADPSGSTSVAIASSRPGHLTVTGTVSRTVTSTSGGSGTTGESSSVISPIDVDTPPDQVTAWHRVLGQNRPNGGVVTCVRLTGLTNGDSIQLTVVGQGDDGITGRITSSGVYGDPFSEPAVQLVPVGPSTIDVEVPIRPDERASAFAVLQDSGPDCAASRTSPAPGHEVGHIVSDTVVHRDVVDDLLAGRPTGVLWPDEEQLRVQLDRTSPTGKFVICVDWWTTSGSAPQRIESQDLAVTPPNFRSLDVAMTGMGVAAYVPPAPAGSPTAPPGGPTPGVVVVPAPPDPVDLGALQIRIEPNASGDPTATFRCTWGGTASTPQPTGTAPIHVCSGIGGTTGDEGLAVTTVYQGRRLTTTVRDHGSDASRECNATPHVCGDDVMTTSIIVPGPGGAAIAAGTLRFAWTADAYDFTAPDAWTFGPAGGPRPVGGADPLAAATPQLDRFSLTSTSDIGPDGAVAHVSWRSASGPVTVSARLETDHLCTRPGLEPAMTFPVTIADPQPSGTVDIGPLCAGETYDVGLAVTDAAGHTSHYSSREPPPDTIGPALSVTAAKIRLSVTTTWDMTVSGPDHSNQIFGITALGMGLTSERAPGPFVLWNPRTPDSEVACLDTSFSLPGTAPTEIDVSEPFSIDLGVQYLRLDIPAYPSGCPHHYGDLDVTARRFLYGRTTIGDGTRHVELIHLGAPDDAALTVHLSINPIN